MIIKKVLNYATIGFILFFVSAIKSKSITFVIDVTSSMKDEISEVQISTILIFDKIINSNDNDIDSFILVTFADTDAEFLIETKDEDDFLSVLDDIQPRKRGPGGKTCPEASMTGILEGLKRSKANSILYAFTDASPNDYIEKESVIKLSLEKSIQVNFLLTGKCPNVSEEINHTYDEVAAATSGIIFNIKKDEVSKIIEYVAESLQYKYSILVQKNIQSAVIEDVKFTIDSKVWNVFISVSSDKPHLKFIIKDSNGNTVKTKLVLSTQKNTIVQLDPEIVGNYIVNLMDVERTVVTVSGSTSLSFQYGFSSIEPNSLKRTSFQPVGSPKDYNYLIIELDNSKKDVSLENVELIDENENVLAEFHLKLINKEDQMYVTEPFKGVVKNFNDLFRIRINGYNDDKEKITRISINKMTYTQPETEVTSGRSGMVIPTEVRILTKSPKIVQSNDNLTLNCEIKASPKPKITWTDSKGIDMPHEVKEFDTSHYISTLNIVNIDKDSTFFCKAVNENGEDNEFVIVEVKKTYFNVLEYPEDKFIVFGKSADFKLIVSADPPAEISWNNTSHIITNDDNFEISSDNTLMKFKNMHAELQGTYFAKASNRYKNEEFKFEIKLIEESEIPEIDKTKIKLQVNIGERVNLHCRTIKGKPTPVKTWFFKNHPSSEYKNMGDADVFGIKKISLKLVGMYKCVAHNNVGNDSFEIEVVVESLPIIRKEGALFIAVEAGKTQILPCTVDGYPKPEVMWILNDTSHIKDLSKYHVYKNNNSLSLTASIFDRKSSYTCFAQNSRGNNSRRYVVTVYVPVHLDPPPIDNVTASVGDAVVLTCPVRGDPRPTVKWFIERQDMEPSELFSYNKINFNHEIKGIQGTQIGKYFCTAVIDGFHGSVEKTLYVDVRVEPVIKETTEGVSGMKGKTLNAVVGDLIVTMPCTLKYGSPKPTIKWTFNKDPNNYIEYENGTLILENITKNNEGLYICKAHNIYGDAILEYELKVYDYPNQSLGSKKYFYEIGTTINKSCVKGRGTLYDRVRWFKDRDIVRILDSCKGTACNYIQHNVSEADNGKYSCRYSIRQKGTDSSESYRFIVGSKPQFKRGHEDKIKKTNDSTILDCNAHGIPAVIKTKWYHNRAEIRNVFSPIYIINNIDVKSIGSYTCEVKNEFSDNRREFKIQSDIVCQVNSPFHKHIPLFYLSPTCELPREPILLGKKINIACEENSSIIGSDFELISPVKAICSHDNVFITDHGNIDISKLKCKNPINIKVTGLRKRCTAGNSELLDIEFTVQTDKPIFTVCWDENNSAPRFIRYSINLVSNETEKPLENNKEIHFITNKYSNINYVDLYDCEKQLNAIYETTGVRLNGSNEICFSKRQLLNPKDMLPGLPQLATFSYLNVVPQWKSYSDQNWQEVEHRIRSLAKSLRHESINDEPLDIWSGASKYDMKLYFQNKSNNRFVTLNSGVGKLQPVPRFIWKVVIQKKKKKGLAIVIINTPNLSLDLIKDDMYPCKVCHGTGWMDNPQWRNPEKGFVFCCSLKEFKKKFSYENLFPSYPILDYK